MMGHDMHNAAMDTTHDHGASSTGHDHGSMSAGGSAPECCMNHIMMMQVRNDNYRQDIRFLNKNG